MARDDSDIKRLRDKFVCVRITRMNGINLRRFEFDYDTTWNAFFLDEKLNVYSRYGGRDHGEPEDRIGKESLLQTMREVLAVHADRTKPRAESQLPRVQPIAPGKLVPRDIPLLRKSHQGCVHCHQVREYQLLQRNADKTFDRRMLFNWPLPENIGLRFDRKHGHRVEKITAHSAAEKSGLQKGDVVVGVNDVPIRSEYDVRWALGRSADKPLTITIRRQLTAGNEVLLKKTVRPAKNWRETELGWRKSLRSVPMPFGFRGYSLTRSQRRTAGLTPSQLAVRVVSIRNIGVARNLSLMRKDTIVALGNVSKQRTLEQLQSDIIRKHRPGDVVRLTVIRDGNRILLQGKLPEWSTDETSVP